MKIILDTNIYISSFAFDSQVEFVYVEILKRNDIDIYFSDETFLELVRKLESDKFTNILKKSKRQINKLDISSFVQYIKQNSIIINNPIEKINFCRDPDDNKFLELALAAKAEYIISGDKDLLEIRVFENIQILKPSEFLKKIN